MAKYSEKIKDKIVELFAAGDMYVDEICGTVGIGKNTFYRWKKEKEDFRDALREVEEDRLDAIGEKAIGGLKQLLGGYTYDEITSELNEAGEMVEKKIVTKRVMPNAAAVIFTLKNRKSADWRDKTETDITSAGEPLNNPLAAPFQVTVQKDNKAITYEVDASPIEGDRE